MLGYFYLELLPGWLGLGTQGLHLSVWKIAETVAIFLGIPLLAGYLTRTIGERVRWREWYETRFCPASALSRFTDCSIPSSSSSRSRVTRSLRGQATSRASRYRCSATSRSCGSGRSRSVGSLGLPYDRTATLAFTAAGNNFELAIAVCIGVFGVTSGEALAGVVGPLIEVPVLVALVYVSLWAKRRFYDESVREGVR